MTAIAQMLLSLLEAHWGILATIGVGIVTRWIEKYTGKNILLEELKQEFPSIATQLDAWFAKHK